MMSSGCSQEQELSSHWHLLQVNCFWCQWCTSGCYKENQRSCCFKKTGDFNVH